MSVWELSRPSQRRRPSDMTRKRFFVMASFRCYLNWVLALGSSGSSGQACYVLVNRQPDKHSSPANPIRYWLKSTVESFTEPLQQSTSSLMCFVHCVVTHCECLLPQSRWLLRLYLFACPLLHSQDQCQGRHSMLMSHQTLLVPLTNKVLKLSNIEVILQGRVHLRVWFRGDAYMPSHWLVPNWVICLRCE